MVTIFLTDPAVVLGLFIDVVLVYNGGKLLVVMIKRTLNDLLPVFDFVALQILKLFQNQSFVCFKVERM